MPLTREQAEAAGWRFVNKEIESTDFVVVHAQRKDGMVIEDTFCVDNEAHLLPAITAIEHYERAAELLEECKEHYRFLVGHCYTSHSAPGLAKEMAAKAFLAKLEAP